MSAELKRDLELSIATEQEVMPHPQHHTDNTPGSGHSASPLPAPRSAMTPMEMLSRAVENGSSIELLEKLMALSERWEANQARKAFNEAFAKFKTEAIKIVRNKLVMDGPLKGKRYAELFSFVDAVTPALATQGLSHSWSITKDEKDWIEITCTIEHALGGSKSVAFGGPPDTGGAKNLLQARISTKTYLEKATLKAVCGLAEQGDDDDGRGGGNGNGGAISEEQVAKLQSLIVEVAVDLPKFLKYLGVTSLAELPSAKFAQAIDAINTKRKSAK